MSIKTNHPVRVAIIQHAPVFLNINESIKKAKTLVEEAANKGAGIIVFPETWLPGYPVWLDESPNAALWDHQPAKSLYKILIDNSLTINGKHFKKLMAIAKSTGTYIVMGAHELVKGTLYNSTIFIGPSGNKFILHRKLMPTYTERLIWGRGDGSTLNIFPTKFGNIGGLICWEHWMPFARAVMHSYQEAIHIAQWPYVKEIHQIASRHYAFEGQCFVLAAGCTLTKKDVVDGYDSLGLKNELAKTLLEEIPGDSNTLLLKGGSAVIGPDGNFITEPLYDKAKIIFADVDIQKIAEHHLTIDTDGHYSRPDIFNLTVNTQPQINVNFKKQ